MFTKIQYEGPLMLIKIKTKSYENLQNKRLKKETLKKYLTSRSACILSYVFYPTAVQQVGLKLCLKVAHRVGHISV